MKPDGGIKKQLKNKDMGYIVVAKYDDEGGIEDVRIEKDDYIAEENEMIWDWFRDHKKAKELVDEYYRYNKGRDKNKNKK